MLSRIEVFVFVLCASLLASVAARAETWQAPVGGKALVLPEGRVACAGTTGDWTIEQDGHAVRPPASDDAIGKSVDVKTAATAAACASAAATSTLTLVSTGRAATLDPNVTVFVDDARVELHGRGLRGTVVRWKVGDRSGEDRCVQPQPEAGGAEKCVVGVGRGLPADASAADLWHAPAGSRDGPDVVTFDAAARRVSRDETLLHPARVVVASLLPHDVTIDLAGGTAAHIPLVHPEAVVGADCGAASCDVSDNVIVVSGVSSVTNALPVRLRLAARVVLQRGDTFDAAPLVQVPVLPCSMSIASGDVLRGVDVSRVVVKVDPRCAGEAGSLRWFSAGRALDVLRIVDRSAAYVLLSVGRVDGDELVVTATRADASTVGQARAGTRAVPLPRAALTLPPDEPVDFVPTNRPANVQWQRAQGSGQLALLPVEGVYDVASREGVTTIQGERGAGGFVALRFAWRVPSLPEPFGTTDLAVITDPIERPMHEASVSVPLSAAKSPVVELVCGVGPSEERIVPGAAAHVAFAERDACRVIFHRERLSPTDGAQHLQLEVEVTRVDGQSRPEAHVAQSLVLRSGDRPRDYWLKGVTGSFDRMTVRVSRGRDVLETDTREEQSVQWSVVFGTGHFRLYGTTAIPTGLYRVSDTGHSGILSLNLGVLMRATWLDSAGHEGFLGLEAGVMAEGLANDTDASGHSLTQVALLTGIGLSVPIANRSLATETSINLHAWFEYEISRDLGGQPGSPFGFVFGPSISIGNVGTNF